MEPYSASRTHWLQGRARGDKNRVWMKNVVLRMNGNAFLAAQLTRIKVTSDGVYIIYMEPARSVRTFYIIIRVCLMWNNTLGPDVKNALVARSRVCARFGRRKWKFAGKRPAWFCYNMQLLHHPLLRHVIKFLQPAQLSSHRTPLLPDARWRKIPRDSTRYK